MLCKDNKMIYDIVPYMLKCVLKCVESVQYRVVQSGPYVALHLHTIFYYYYEQNTTTQCKATFGQPCICTVSDDIPTEILHEIGDAH